MTQPDPDVHGIYDSTRPDATAPVAAWAYGRERARTEHQSAGRCDVSPPPVFADCCILRTGHGNWHRNSNGSRWTSEPADKLVADQAATLTVEQEIRAHALHAAVCLDTDAERIDIALAAADRFAAWIRDGSDPQSIVDTP